MPTGTLYIVATPIGNLEDITLRAIRMLKEADLIAAEDTRHTRHLLDGKSVALVTDAGTPGISDPGYFLINLAVDQKVPVVPIPGPTAAIAALSISGLPTDSFVFEGFLSSKQTARLKRLQELAAEKIGRAHV